MNLRDSLVATNFVFFIGEGFNGLGIGIGEGGGKLRRTRTNRNRDNTRIALEIKLRAVQGLDDLIFRDSGSRVIGAVLLNDLRHNLFATPIGDTCVEDFGVGITEVRCHVCAAGCGVANGTAHINRELTRRLINGRRNTIDNERDNKTNEEENEDGKPALRNDAAETTNSQAANHTPFVSAITRATIRRRPIRTIVRTRAVVGWRTPIVSR